MSLKQGVEKMRRALLLLGLAVFACAPAVAQQPRRAAQDKTARPDLALVYAKWLDEDVAYIITPTEKRAFQMLKSDAEREQFVEAFWRRRDPDPDTPANEFRDEHYARVAHANQNFTTAAASGWRTDRGRVFIMYGKPHDVSKTADGELWVYRVLPGVGTNVEMKFVLDPATGDLRLRQ
jgi:GWxTD domain-containing protein